MAPLQLKGCTRTSSLFSPTTPSGASERRHCQCLCSPLRPRGRAGVFRRREGPASQSLLGTPPSFFPRLPAGYERGVSTSGGFAAADPSLVRVRFPYVSAYVFTVAGIYARWVRVPGRSDVSRARSTPSLAIATHMSSSLKVPCTVTQSTGASGRVFPDATEYQFDLSVSKACTATLHSPVQISDRALAFSEIIWSKGIVYGVVRSDRATPGGKLFMHANFPV